MQGSKLQVTMFFSFMKLADKTRDAPIHRIRVKAIVLKILILFIFLRINPKMRIMYYQELDQQIDIIS